MYCDDDNPKKCLTCRGFGTGTHADRQCIKSCPPDQFQYENRRCTSEAQCRQLKAPVKIRVKPTGSLQYPYIPFQKECRLECPSSYMVNASSGVRKCEFCGDKCEHTCEGGNIESISDAQLYKGCTHIQGSLIIQMQRQVGRE